MRVVVGIEVCVILPIKNDGSGLIAGRTGLEITMRTNFDYLSAQARLRVSERSRYECNFTIFIRINAQHMYIHKCGLHLFQAIFSRSSL